MAADLMVVVMVLLLLLLLLLVYKVLLVLDPAVLVLSSTSSVPYDVHRLQVLERVALARVGGAVEGGRLQPDRIMNS